MRTKKFFVNHIPATAIALHWNLLFFLLLFRHGGEEVVTAFFFTSLATLFYGRFRGHPLPRRLNP
jgi:hypothetical protein